MDVDVLDILKSQVVEEFSRLCKQLGNGYYVDCYQDILTKISLIENYLDIENSKKYLYQYL